MSEGARLAAQGLRWLFGVFIVLPLLTGGVSLVLYGAVLGDGAVALWGLLALGLGIAGMTYLQKHM